MSIENTQIFSSIRIKGVENNDICLYVEKGTILNNLNISGSLNINSFKFNNNPHENYTLKCIDTIGNSVWDKTMDYRLLGNTQNLYYQGNTFNTNNLTTSSIIVSNINNFINLDSNLLNISGNINISNDLSINGNLLVSGTMFTINSSNLNITNSLIKLAQGNTSDTLDIGFYGEYYNTETKYTGLFRNHLNKVYYLFDELNIEPNFNVITTNLNFANLKLNNLYSNGIIYSDTFSINNILSISNQNIILGTSQSLITINGNSNFNNKILVNDNLNLISDTITLNGSSIFNGGTTQNICNFYSNNNLDPVISINNQGKFGINNSNPNYLLDIIGVSNWTTKISNNSTNLFFANNDNGILIDTTDISSSYNFLCKNNSMTFFKVQNDGKIGINTDTPTELFEIGGTTSGIGAQIGNAKIGVWSGNNMSMSIIHSDLKNNSSSYSLRQHSSGETYLNCGVSKNIHFRCNDNELMTLTGNGYLGINNSSPLYPLDINGDARISGNLFIGSYNFRNLNVNTDILLGSTANIINVDTTSGDKNIYLPNTNSTFTIFYYIFKKSNTNLLNIICTGSDIFEDDTTFITLFTNKDRVYLLGNAGIWYTM